MTSLAERLGSLSPRQRKLLEMKLEERGVAAARVDHAVEAAGAGTGPALERVSRELELPLSFDQRRLWFLDRLEPGSPAYNVPLALRLELSLDVVALKRTLSEIVRRHEVLRTVFVAPRGNPVQVIVPPAPLPCPLIDLGGVPRPQREEEARRLAGQVARRPFDLARGPVFRAHLMRLGPGDHVLLATMHHIASDGGSVEILMREMGALYAAFSRGRPSPLRELPLQYGDYACWQRRRFREGFMDSELSYWRQKLAGAPPVLELPADHPRPATQSFRGKTSWSRFAAALTASLAELSRREGVTAFMVLLAAFQTLLLRYTGRRDIVLGSPVTNRDRPEVKGLIGFFTNTLALRVDLSGDPSFRELLARVREVTLEAYSHQELPFEKLVEELSPERDLAYSPLFQVMLVLLHPQPPQDGAPMTPISLETGAAQFDLTLSIMLESGGLECTLNYSRDLFDETTIRRLTGHWRALLRGIVAAPGDRLSQMPLLPDSERHQLVAEARSTAVAFPEAERCLHELFAHQAARTPEAVAVTFGPEHSSYGGVSREARAWARRLRRLGVRPETRLGVLLERSPRMVTALLGILEAGGAYVPLDPSYPAERLAFMAQDAAISVLVLEEGLEQLLPSYGGPRVYPEDAGETPSRGIGDGAEPVSGASYPSGSPTPDNLAYVIYTSGSTGTPKGVQISHRALVNFLLTIRRRPGLSREDVLLSVTTLSFDIAALELFLPLVLGARLELVDRATASDAALLAARLAAARATVMQATPATWRLLADGGWRGLEGLRAFCGGEALDGGLARRIQDRTASLWNLYGPTETTVWSAVHPVRAGREPIPIGRPIANTRIWLLDRGREPVPLGVAGELHIGGLGLARGYLERQGPTAERFVPDGVGGEPGARLYRTGDLARWLADGVAEFLGRIDHQVKVRGFRIELGEVEAALAAHPRVREAVVAVYRSRQLAAYVVPSSDSGEALDFQVLRGDLGEKLPEYMVPSVWVRLEALPLTPNGKVDRAALGRRALPASDPRTAYRAPRTPVEELLAGLWAEILGVGQVGIDDNFFALGGHSLLATQLIYRVSSALGVELALRTLFEAPALSSLAARIEAARRQGRTPAAPPLAKAARDGAPALSFAQERLWFLDRLEPGSSAYNVPAALRVRGRLDTAALAWSLSQVVRRHETLRTAFVEEAGEGNEAGPVQVVLPPRALEPPRVDLRALPSRRRERELRRLAAEEAARPFDLSRAPLVRVTLLALGERDHGLLVTAHHIVCDAWSIGIFIRELGVFYRHLVSGEPVALGELPVQYADFARWQRRWLSGEVLEAELDYWKEQLESAPTVLELPTDHPRPAVFSSRGRARFFTLPETISQALESLGRQQGTTLFMTLFAAFATLLARYTGKKDLLVGSPIAGRNRAEIEGLIGFFVNTLVLRGDLSGDPPFRALLTRVRETTLAAYAHQDLPFEMLVEELQPERSLSHSPLFQVMLALDNAPMGALALPEVDLTALEVEADTAKFDLSLALAQTGRRLAGSLDYRRDLFEELTIRRLLGHFETLLGALAADPELRLSELPLLTEAEKHQSLIEWNDTSRRGARPGSVHERFEEQVEKAPDAVAIDFDDGALTYGQLNRQANRLAHHLRGLGVGPDAPVGICLERSPEMIVGLLGILKAGGAYMPLDPSYPEDRLIYMSQDAQTGIDAPVLVAREGLTGLVSRHRGPVACLTSDGETFSRQSPRNPVLGIAGAHLAYVIYTSGSTGRPKGVAVPHGAALASFLSAVREFGLGPADRMLQFCSLNFDISLEEILPTLLAGARLVLSRKGPMSGRQFVSMLVERRVTTANLPTAFWHQLTDELAADAEPFAAGTLRLVVVGGEAVSPGSAALWRRVAPSSIRLLNGYGPSETVVTATKFEVVANAPATAWVPIGRPLAGRTAYVLDGGGRPVPPGVLGELFLGGEVQARGYLGRPETTAESFLPDPFGSGAGRRLYRTGDRTRLLANGNLDFLGRRDRQVKIRGFRIEPGEIEAVLKRHDAVRTAVVEVRRTAAGNPFLAAYLVREPDGRGREDAAPEPSEPAPLDAKLRGFLAEKLPAYMLPAAFVELDALPLTPGGKVDRRALPEPARSAQETAADGTRSPVEDVVAGIWTRVLGLERVGADENFFELGGHSLLVTRLISRLQKAFGLDLPVRVVFEAPTVRGLAARIEAAARAAEGLDAPGSVPMERVDRDRELPLSFAQQRLWFLDQLDPGSSAYNIRSAFRLRGKLDLAVLEAGIAALVRRHETLRTTFATVDGRPAQVISPPAPFTLPTVDLLALPSAGREAAALELARADARRAFDLARGPLLRVRALRLGAEDHAIVLTMHHIISDLWSMEVFVRELVTLYGAGSRRLPASLPELRFQYADFAHWQRRWLTAERLEAQLAYWRGRLRDVPAVLRLPTDRKEPAAHGFRGGRRVRAMSRPVRPAIESVARRQGATLFMSLLAAFQVLLYRHTGQEDFCVGTPIANRRGLETENLIGFFVNSLALRATLTAGTAYRELLARVRETALGAYAHQDLPFEKLVDELQLERRLGRNPLFQVMFLHDAPEAAFPADARISELTLSPWDLGADSAVFDLILSLEPAGESFAALADYRTELFDATSVHRLLGHLESLLAGVAAEPDRPVGALPLLSAGEHQQVRVEWQGERVAEPRDHDLSRRSLHRLVEAQVRRCPEAVAVSRGGRRITYRELDARAGRLARYLEDLGVGPEVPVGVCLERCPEMVTGILGVLKAGGAYLPLDPAYPGERLAAMLDDARAPVLLTLERRPPLQLPERRGLRVVRLDADWPAIAACRPRASRPEVEADNLAYVIFTSGSTGRPKGVMIPHGGIVNTLLWRRAALGLGGSDRILQNIPASFDPSIWQLFGALASGALSVLARPRANRDAAYLLDVMAREAITVTDFPPSLLAVVLDHEEAAGCRALRHVFAGGEALPPEVAERFAARLPAADLHNIYGPTEASIDSTLWTPRGRVERVHIGRPIANREVFLADARLRPVPAAAAGEICLGGPGLARGYLGAAAQTAAVFVPHPSSAGPGRRLYRTGDLGRWLGDGNVEFLGRLDHQVKVRGFRIEPGEVEAVLLELPEVREAFVTARAEGPGPKRLVAYLVPRTGREITFAEARAGVKARLPEFMVPSAVVVLPSMPRLASGKVDAARLPAVGSRRPELDQPRVAPRTPVEERLAQIWQDVLRLDHVGVHDNFFELGGDSILSIQIVARARRAGLRLTPRQIFRHQTIGGLAAAARAEETEELEPADVSGPVPLTPIQHWMFAQGFSDPHHFNQAVLLEARRALEPRRLRTALALLLEHHAALRFRFVPSGAGWRQVAMPPGEPASVVQVDLAALPPARQRPALEQAAAAVQKSLDLTRGPLVRLALFELGGGRPARLLLVVHHLVVDGVSWRILLEDLRSIYEGLVRPADGPLLPPATTSFQRWAHGLAELARTDALVDEQIHWLAQPRREVAGLPVDDPAGEALNTDASVRTVQVVLDAEATRALLKEVPGVYHTQVNDVLLTALAQAFAGWTGHPTLLLELEGHGREDILGGVDLSRTVGWFTVLYPLLLDLRQAGEAAGPGEQLKALKEQIRRVPHRGIGYGLLRYSSDRETAERLRNLPRPQVGFNYLGQLDQALDGTSFFAPAPESCGPTHSPRRQRSHLLEINSSVAGGCLRTSWDYSENVHRRSTVEALAKDFLERLRDLIRHCRSPAAGGYTPSDLPLAGLDQKTLDRLIGASEHLDVEDLYPLSPMQEGMLFHTLLEPGSAVYYQQLSTRLEGDLDTAAFRGSWQRIIDQHGVLRASFVWEGLERPLQKVFRQVPLPWREEDWRSLAPERQRERLDERLREARQRGFDLSRAPLMSLTLLRLADRTWQFVWSFHHTLLDGWSTPLLLRDVFSAYRAIRRGLPVKLTSGRPFRDYIAWLEARDRARTEEHWRASLAGLTAPTRLAGEPSGHGGSKPEYGSRRIALSAAATRALEHGARGRQTTLSTLLQAAWALLLARYSGRDDVVFGITVAGRPAELPEVETMVGLFINSLPLRVRLDPAASLADRLRGLQTQVTELQAFEWSPLVQIRRWSEIPSSLPLFESLLIFENYPVVGAAVSEEADDLRVEVSQAFERTNYPLTLTIHPAARLSMELTYDRRSFDGVTIGRTLRHLRTLLQSFPTSMTARLAALPLLSYGECQQMLVEWNDRHTAPPGDAAVTDLFEAQAKRTAEAVAVAFEGDRLTYRELDRRADRLARRLRASGVGPEVPVGICLDRSLELPVAVLGVLKADGCYLPLDPELPPERLAFLLEDTRAPAVVTRPELEDRLSAHRVRRVTPDAGGSEPADHGDAGPPRSSTAGHLAYVIFTSGSTGRPKGVQVPHHTVVNFLRSMREQLEISGNDVSLAVTTLSFDISVLELLLPLTAGGRVEVARAAVTADGRELSRRLAASGATVMQATPATWRLLREAGWPGLPGLKILCGGEALHRDLAEDLLVRGSGLWNMYGPTETTVWSAIHPVTAGQDPVSIGRPIANTRIHLLDARLRPAPLRAAGELCIGGAGLARGYLRRPGLNAEKFVPDPLAGRPGERLYRTGDLARYLHDGTLECLGRVDHQVKIRGFRIELGEIEAALSEHSAVRAAVVAVRKESLADRRLVAYVVPELSEVVATVAPGDPMPPELTRRLRDFLAERLPAYMLPAAYVTLAALPLMVSGKVDRRALPDFDPTRAAARVPPAGPRDTLEMRLVRLWQETLDLEAVGLRDDFFEIGGHSLLALRLMTRIQQETGRELALSTLFENPTVERLAVFLRRLDSEPEERRSTPLVPIRPEGSRPPFFCVHPLGGQVLCYGELARHLGSEQPVYGLEMSPARLEGDSFDGIERLAGDYVETLAELRPAESYRLGGYSFGGLVAFEMARQLRAAGRSVDLLAIFDTVAPGGGESPEEIDDTEILVTLIGEANLDRPVEELRLLSTEERLLAAIEIGRRAGRLPPDFGLETARQVLNVFKHNARMAQRYAPAPYSGKLVLFESEDLESATAGGSWDALAEGGVERHAVPGTHHTILASPHVASLARRLETCFARLETDGRAAPGVEAFSPKDLRTVEV